MTTRSAHYSTTRRSPAALKRLVAASMPPVLAAALLLSASGTAEAVSQRVKNACAGDYSRFCPSYAVDTPQLRACMRQAGKRLSRPCIDALVDAGEIKRPKR